MCVREEGGGEKASHINHYTYLLSWTHLTVADQTRHTLRYSLTFCRTKIRCSGFYNKFLYWFKKLRSGYTLGWLFGRRGVMDPIVEVVALVLGFIGWVMVGVTLPNRYWKTSTVDGNVITTSTIYENLWMSCATDSTGVHNCREFPSLLALNSMLTQNIYHLIAINNFNHRR